MANNAKLLKIAFLVIVLIITTNLSSYAQSSKITTAPGFASGFPMLTGENVMLMWVPVPDAVKYKIYLDGNEIGEAPAPPFTHSAPTEVGVYKYTITGIDANGVEGSASEAGELSIFRLEQPKNVSHKFLDGLLKLHWASAPGAVIYEVYRADSNEGPFKLIVSTTKTKYIDTEVQEKKEYVDKKVYYKIVSVSTFDKKSTDTETHEFNVQKAVRDIPHHFDLKIYRTKEVLFVKPEGGGTDIQSSYDAVFLSDGEHLVNVDTLARKVAVINSEGREVSRIGEASVRPDRYSEPIRVAVDEDDNIYLLDNKKPTIFVYGSNGDFIAAFDTHTIDEKVILDHYKAFTEPVTPKLNAILVHGDKIYAADKMTGVIQIYDKSDGRFIDYYRKVKTGEIIYFGVVGKMLLSDDDKLYLSLPLASNANISVVDFKTNEHLSYFDYFIQGDPGTFYTVSGMAFEKGGDLIVSDGIRHTVQVFHKEDGFYKYHIGGEKALRTKNSTVNRPAVNLDYSGALNVDSRGRLWIYLGREKGFSVREYIGDKPWDSTVDEPEL